MSARRLRDLCGTVAGYLAHEVRAEVACPGCWEAWVDAQTLERLAAQPEQPLQYRAALEGREVAEALTTPDRARLVTELWWAGWADHLIAAHTRMTLFTTAEIRRRLGLAPNQPSHTTTWGAA